MCDCYFSLEATPRTKRSPSFRTRQRKSTVTQKPKKKIKLSSKLSKCVNYIQSVHFPGIEGYDGGVCVYVVFNQVASLYWYDVYIQCTNN